MAKKIYVFLLYDFRICTSCMIFKIFVMIELIWKRVENLIFLVKDIA